METDSPSLGKGIHKAQEEFTKAEPSIKSKSQYLHLSTIPYHPWPFDPFLCCHPFPTLLGTLLLTHGSFPSSQEWIRLLTLKCEYIVNMSYPQTANFNLFLDHVGQRTKLAK